MKPGWQHVKEAITTDQKNLTDDEHIHEQEKRELRLSEKDGKDTDLIPKKGKKSKPAGKK